MGGRRVLVAGPAAVALVVGSSAGATITPSDSAINVTAALTGMGGLATGAAFVTKPPAGATAAVADTPLGAFPTSGHTYAILSTGDATLASTPNTAPDTGVGAGGGHVRGDSDVDVTILKIDLNV